ncbi:hypothetical protein BC937DRAFT_88700 [Endogone sp. FLAS-F59071]|nr:hypothetical protein BC937DRAFT_88700 [Endogone sp. FLAS-F59071]|eukprot:RUS18500.1 hypothetical protein BC937DRAFT_88700 [Endogone sp. FLAS-F59071]
MSTYDLSEKHHPIWLDAKHTLPRSGDKRMVSPPGVELSKDRINKRFPEGGYLLSNDEINTTNAKYSSIRAKATPKTSQALLPDNGVDFLDGVLQLEISVGRRQLKLEDQTIDFVDDERQCELFADRVADDLLRVCHYLQKKNVRARSIYGEAYTFL